MLQFIYDLFNSQYFGVLLLVWISIDVIWMSRWQALLIRVRKILVKPLVFQNDPEANDHSLLYPRKFLEQLAQRKFGSNQEQIGETFLTKQKDQLFDIKYPLRTISYVTFFIFFLLFLLADAIAVSATLELMGFNADFLPSYLNKIEISLLGGAVFAAIIGIWILIEASGDPNRPSISLPYEHFSQEQRVIIRTFSIFIFLFSTVISVALAVQRLIAIGILDATPTVDIVLAFILYGLITINVFIAAALSFTFALQGFLVLLYVIAYCLIGILPILVFFIDIIWRALHTMLDVVIWFVFTPFLAVPFGVYRLIKALSPKPTSHPEPNKE
jgi:hypothetical protein